MVLFVTRPCKTTGSKRYMASWFGGQREFSSGDIMALVCHVILQDHVTKESNNVMGWSRSR